MALTVYSHPDHAYNVTRMLSAMKASLQLFTRIFSPYQFDQLRIIEFPAYANFAESFANTVPYSENLGFLHHHQDVEKIDMVTYATAHEVAHQWWAHQLVPSDQQGAAMLTDTFAQYSALRVMEKLYGRAQIQRFLQWELDQYLAARGGEVFQELPLARVEGQGYIYYQKGSLVMYWLKEVLGEQRVDKVLRQMLDRYAFKGPPYPNSRDFLTLLYAEAPKHRALIEDLFERITLYDLKASHAVARRRGDGKYDVEIEVVASKFYADGQGAQREAPLDEELDIGAFRREPGKRGFDEHAVLDFQRVRVHSGRQMLHLVTSSAPFFAGVDPYNTRVDRVSDDNVIAVDDSSR